MLDDAITAWFGDVVDYYAGADSEKASHSAEMLARDLGRVLKILTDGHPQQELFTSRRLQDRLEAIGVIQGAKDEVDQALTWLARGQDKYALDRILSSRLIWMEATQPDW